MKPTILNIQGSNPSGMGDPAADPRGPQSITVNGSGLANAKFFIYEGPGVEEGVRAYFPNDTSLLAVAKLLVKGPYQALVVTSDGQASDWFSFQVG
ncbi:MAG TPA: hypothetical protein VKQ11_00730 [Candidatus Sulfotelmatobacter sp.]|nr:hypothetical protein [Candidatus Sulfotelmatobacter sp.]